MTWKRGEMCEGCAGRKGTEANSTPTTVGELIEAIKSSEPFYCHESTAVLDPNGTAVDRQGRRYRALPFERWRLCRAWMNARAEIEKKEPNRGETPPRPDGTVLTQQGNEPMIKLKTEVLEVLDRSTCNGNALALPGQLDRKLYVDVAKIIEAAGGKWNKKAKAHLFDGDAAEAIEPVILTGEVLNRKQEFGQFDTPTKIGERMVRLARIKEGHKVLEPNAGNGALVRLAMHAGAHVFGYEIDPKRAAKLRASLFYPEGGFLEIDFLKVEPKPRPIFDVVLMNPPFAKQADIDHVLYATRFLIPGGRLVSVMGAGITFRSNRKTTDFRDFLNQQANHAVDDLPENAFASSGTNVNAVLVSFNVPR